MSHRAVLPVLAMALATGLVVGATWSTFTNQTSNGGNTFAAASSFGPEFVKQLGTGTCSGGSSTITVPAGGAAAGNTVVVGLVLRGNVSGTATASDSRGNSYSKDADVTNSNIRTIVFSSRLATALIAGNTITVGHSFSDDSQGISAAEFSGIVSGTRVDVADTATGQSTSPSASVTTTNARDLLVGTVGNQNNRTYTEASGWDTLADVLPSCGGSPGRATLHTAYRIVSSAGTYAYAPTLSNSDRWAEALVAYKG